MSIRSVTAHVIYSMGATRGHLSYCHLQNRCGQNRVARFCSLEQAATGQNLHSSNLIFVPDPSIDAGMFNKVMQTMTKGESINRHGRFERLISSIIIKCDLTEVQSLCYLQRNLEIQICSSMSNIRVNNSDFSSVSHECPPDSSIFHMLCFRRYVTTRPIPLQEYTLISTEKWSTSTIRNFFGLTDRCGRSSNNMRRVRVIKITIQMTTAKPRTTFSGYKTLRQWLREDNWESMLATKTNSALGDPVQPSEIVLRSNLSTETLLQDMRNAIKDVIRLTYGHYEKILFNFSLSHPCIDGCSLIEHICRKWKLIVRN